MAEAVKVIVRCRPMNGREKGLNCKSCVSMDSAKGQCFIQNPADAKGPPKSFTFDGAYHTDSTTEAIYSEIAYPLVEGVTEGYNGTIFAYGQTGCGKSFSMQGITDPPTQRGIIPRSFAHIFQTTSIKEGVKYLIHASYLEIYNEDVRDLLGKDSRAKLDLKEHPDKGVYCPGLSMHPVHNVGECEAVMNKGWMNRSTGATLMNAESSRSHSIFCVYIEMVNTDDSGEDHIRAGKLNLVDLAGSERQGKTGATGDRLKEATKINLSLSALGNVISALVDGKSKHIPYRDSKLTRLLQDSLGGNTKTMMVACLSPADNNYDETLSTLRYANRAKNIKNKPKINEDPKDALLRQYQEEIEKLKAMLAGQAPMDAVTIAMAGGAASSQNGGMPAQVSSGSPDQSEAMREELETEKTRIKDEYEAQMEEMKEAYEAEKSNKAKLQQDMLKLRAFYDGRLNDVDGQLANLPSTAEVLGEDFEGAALSQDGTAKKKGDTERPDSTTSEDGGIVGPDISDIGKPVILGPDGLPQIQKEVPSGDNRQPVIPESLFQDQQVALLKIQQQQQQKLQQKAVDEEGIARPNASPVHDGEAQAMEAKQKEALMRLLALQQQMVGGECADNAAVKEEHDKKMQFADDIRQKLDKANRQMEDDGIVLTIFDNVQEEVKVKNQVLEDRKVKIDSLERDIIDIHSEFEFDRIEYLDSIRKQDRQVAYLEAVIERIHPCLRRDCNYFNMDKVKRESHFSEDEDKWMLPKMMIERTALPSQSTAGSMLPGAAPRQPRMQMNGDHDDDFDDERLREKLRRSEDQSHTLQPRRASKLLSGEPVNKLNMQEVRSSIAPMAPMRQVNSPMTNGHYGYDDDTEPMSKDLRAAQVHGQIHNDEGMGMVRKPSRLDALPPVTGKKKKKRGGLDPF